MNTELLQELAMTADALLERYKFALGEIHCEKDILDLEERYSALKAQLQGILIPE